MVSRTEILKRRGLLDHEEFDVRADTYDGIWKIIFDHKGAPAHVMDIGAARLFAEEVREVDPGLADKAKASVKEARRHLREDP